MLATKRSLRLAFVTALAALCLTCASPALAGKPVKPPRGGGSATVSLVLLESTDGLPHWNQTVTFDIVTTATTSPFVNLKCHQGGLLVLDSWEGFFEGTLDDGIMGLASGPWSGGEADCTAYVTKPDRTVLGSTSFHVYG